MTGVSLVQYAMVAIPVHLDLVHRNYASTSMVVFCPSIPVVTS